MREFFPESDFGVDPLVPNKEQAIWLINEVGICHAALGDLQEASNYLKRVSRKVETEEWWIEAATSRTNLAAVECLLGNLSKAGEDAVAAEGSAARAPRSSNRQRLLTRAAAIQGWVMLWRGDANQGVTFFENADQRSGGADVVDWQTSAEGIRYGDAVPRQN